VSILADLDAFLGEHRRCGDLDGGVEDGPGWWRVWMACSCGGLIERRWRDAPAC
jgi:hypothetical protein